MTRYSKERLIKYICMIIYGWRKCMKVPIFFISIIFLFFLTLFSRKLRQEEDIIEYVKDCCLQEDGIDLIGVYSAESILIFFAFLPIMVITALIFRYYQIDSCL